MIYPHYITDSSGKKISVVLPIKEFKIIMGKLEDLNDIKLYNEAKLDSDLSIPIDEAFRMIESKRK